MPKQPAKILIIEDEKDIRESIVDKFVIEGFEVIKAKNGKQGLKFALKEHPDLILLDVLMPRMDGMAVMQKLRQDAWGKGVLIILLTNLSADKGEIIKRVVEDEPAFYLVKSDWKLSDVVKKVKEVLGLVSDID